jgi:NAD(P)-dependent dehydrogenase (short-subunit alcohol dehydrogenase family)
MALAQNSGAGQATAIAFAQEAADVVMTYLEDECGANSIRQQLEAARGRSSESRAGESLPIWKRL